MKKLVYTALPVLALGLSACNDFLDMKPDMKLTVPNSIEDATYLLNDYTVMNMGYPIWGEQGTDDYYVTKANWEAATFDQRNAYVWADEPYMDVVQWQRPYKAVYYANQVLEMLSRSDRQVDFNAYDRNLGGAYFYRAFAFQILTEVHCPAYMENTASNEWGIPLRLNPGVDEKSTRASLKATYDQILNDFRQAVKYLPIVEPVKGRPSKGAAYAGIARAYMNMGDFDNAYRYADSCLQLNPTLLDYNTLKSTDEMPIPQFNVEVLFNALSAGTGIMGNNSSIIDDDLYKTYEDGDLRKKMFFRSNANPANSFSFKGSYNQSLAQLFMGITTSEICLVKAEAACRVGKVGEALATLDRLRKNRWDKNMVYIPIAENNPEVLLQIILQERRKELLFRGRRWADLKRLNLDSRFQKTLKRQIADEIYTLPANDVKYAFRLSETLIRVGDIAQNKR